MVRVREELAAAQVPLARGSPAHVPTTWADLPQVARIQVCRNPVVDLAEQLDPADQLVAQDNLRPSLRLPPRLKTYARWRATHFALATAIRPYNT